jgi:hypothetical protein
MSFFTFPPFVLFYLPSLVFSLFHPIGSAGRCAMSSRRREDKPGWGKKQKQTNIVDGLQRGLEIDE